MVSYKNVSLNTMVSTDVQVVKIIMVPMVSPKVFYWLIVQKKKKSVLLSAWELRAQDQDPLLLLFII